MHTRRFGLILTFFFSTNLIVGATEPVCTSPMVETGGMASQEITSPEAMAGMGMSAIPPASSDSTSPEQTPCEGSKVPAGCAASSGCVSTALNVLLTDQAAARGVSPGIAVIRIDQPASRSTTPEPPPPRA